MMEHKRRVSHGALFYFAAECIHDLYQLKKSNPLKALLGEGYVELR